MSKKLICLFLSLVMILGVCLTACGEKDDEEAKSDIADTAGETAQTLAMYLMSESAVSEDTVNAIEEAVNNITKTKFKTKLELYFYTESEYYEKLEAAFATRDKHKADGTLASSKQEAQSGEDETETDDNGIVTIKYPTLTEYQVDIFYLGGKDRYLKYNADGKLMRLDDEINSSSKDLTTNIPSQFLSGIKTLNKGTYAIPTSKPIGEYTYLLLNKDALETAYRRSDTGSTDYSTYTSLTCDDVKDFLEFVSDKDNALSDKYYPLYTNLGEDEFIVSNLSNLKYWGVDDEGRLSDAFSVLGGYYGKNDEYLEANKYARLENLFANTQFINDIKTLKEYELRDYYNAGEGNKEFAVGYMTGGRELVEKYGDKYELIPVAYPRITEDEIYSDMFAVCSYTSNVGRSMKVLTLLNTDPTFRNLILYGIEDEHYQLLDTGVDNEYGEDVMAVKRLEKGKNEYMMDVNKTGNTFIAYPLVDESVSLKGHGIVQNQEAKTALDMGFALDYNAFVVDKTSLLAIKKLSDQILKEYTEWKCDDAIVNGEFKEDVFNAEFYEFTDGLNKRVSESADVKAHLACQLENAHEKDGKYTDPETKEVTQCHSLYCCYQGWLKDNKVVS